LNRKIGVVDKRDQMPACFSIMRKFLQELQEDILSYDGHCPFIRWTLSFHTMDTVLSSIIIIHCKVMKEKCKNNYKHVRTDLTHSWKCDTTKLQQKRKDVSWW
jgi:hypothetical protein